MKNLNVMFEECYKFLCNCGLKMPERDQLEVAVNTRAHSFFGVTRRIKGRPGCFKIEINKDLLDDRNPDTSLVETIIHELLHTVHGCFNHGKKWQSIVDVINQRTGLHISCTSTIEGKGLVVFNPPNRAPLYRVICPACGCSIEYRRAAKVILHPENFVCGRCHKDGLVVERLRESKQAVRV